MKNTKNLKKVGKLLAFYLCLTFCFSTMTSLRVLAEESSEGVVSTPPVVENSVPAQSEPSQTVVNAEPASNQATEAPAVEAPVSQVEPATEAPVNSNESPAEEPAQLKAVDEPASEQIETATPVEPLEISVIQPASPAPTEPSADETVSDTVADSEVVGPPATTSQPIVFDFSQKTASEPVVAICGNAIIEANEQCDDKNLKNGDGCSATCQTEKPVSQEVTTGIILPTNKKQTIVAQWQMSVNQDNTQTGLDDSPIAGGQFLPSGQYQVDKKVMVCTVVANDAGLSSIKSVSATINYPQNIAFNNSTSSTRLGCGGLQSELALNPLEPVIANDLLCNQIRNQNNNLLKWSNDLETSVAYNYEQLCGETGFLAKQTAQAYCAQISLAYNDPAGDYQIKISAQDNYNVKIEADSNLQYLELTTFESDFSDIQYGVISLNEAKTLLGDKIFNQGTAPTIRNTGNTRLQIKIWQNDFNLGKTGEEWNLEYQAKIGDQLNYTKYLPDQTVVLNDFLDLGQAMNADFGVLVKRYPETSDQQAYLGKMTLSADKLAYLGCQ